MGVIGRLPGRLRHLYWCNERCKECTSKVSHFGVGLEHRVDSTGCCGQKLWTGWSLCFLAQRITFCSTDWESWRKEGQLLISVIPVGWLSTIRSDSSQGCGTFSSAPDRSVLNEFKVGQNAFASVNTRFCFFLQPMYVSTYKYCKVSF